MFLHRRLKTLQQRVLELQAGVLQHADYFLSHAPYTRLVQKAFVRLALQDALRTANG
ncbi:hydroxymethylglutaryl-coenzyme A synthase C terminal, partial [Haematococcus lacustris]